MYCCWCSPCCSCRVCVLCLAAHLRQWAVDVFEAVRRPSSVPLQFNYGCLSEPFHSRIPLFVAPVRTPCPVRVIVGVCLYAALVWLCLFFGRCSSLCRFIMWSIREEVCCVLACRPVTCCVGIGGPVCTHCNMGTRVPTVVWCPVALSVPPSSAMIGFVGFNLVVQHVCCVVLDCCI